MSDIIIDIDNYYYSILLILGLPPRSAHKLRKTFISTLLDAHMNLDTVRRIAGHRDEKVTLSNYYYDRSTPDDIRAQLENALK